MRCATAAIVVVIGMLGLSGVHGVPDEDAVIPESTDLVQSPGEASVLKSSMQTQRKNHIFKLVRGAMLKAAPGATVKAQTQIPSQMFRSYLVDQEIAEKAPEKSSKKKAKAAAMLKIQEKHWDEVDAKEKQQQKAKLAAKVAKEDAQKLKGQKVIKENALKMKEMAKQKEMVQKKVVKVAHEKDNYYTSATIKANEAAVKKKEGDWHEVSGKVVQVAEKNQKNVVTAEAKEKKQWKIVTASDARELKKEAKDAAIEKKTAAEKKAKKAAKKYAALVKWKKESIKKELAKQAKLEAKERAAEAAATGTTTKEA